MEPGAVRCCAACSFHLHRDQTLVLAECGRCVFHARCVAAVSSCEQCCLPVGTVDREVFSVCNVRRCSAPGGVLCAACAAELADRFAHQLARMGRLSANSARGWLTSFGNLCDASRPAVVAAVFAELVAVCSRGYLVEFSEATAAVHFTERLAALARKHLQGARTTYEALVALDSRLPPEAAGVVRRFVSENRRHFQEDPRTREVMLLGTGGRAAPPRPSLEHQELSHRVAEPGTLVGAKENGAAAVVRGVRGGTVHTLGREIFTYTSRFSPRSARQSRKREAEWAALLRKIKD